MESLAVRFDFSELVNADLLKDGFKYKVINHAKKTEYIGFLISLQGRRGSLVIILTASKFFYLVRMMTVQISYNWLKK